MHICAPLTRSQCKVSDTQGTVRPVGLLLGIYLCIKENILFKIMIKQNNTFWQDVLQSWLQVENILNKNHDYIKKFISSVP